MSDTNDNSKLDHRELTNTELDAVSGGLGFGPMAFQVKALMELKYARPPCGTNFNSLGHPTNPG